MDLQIIRTRHPPEIYIPQLASLMEQENISIPQTELKGRMTSLPEQDRLLLAVQGDHLIGYAHLRITPSLHTEEAAEVLAIIVERTHRRKGIGRRLILAAESWARQSKRAHLILSTDVTRTAAHAFYSALGYELSATKVEFVRILSDLPSGSKQYPQIDKP